MIVNPGLRRSISGGVAGLLRRADINLSAITHSAIPTRGALTPSFTRATEKRIPDHEGVLRTLIAGELGFPGARRVRNLLTGTTTLATQDVTTEARTYLLSFYGTGSVALSGTVTDSLAGTGASNRVSEVYTATAGTLTLTVTGSVTSAQLEDITGRTDQTTPSEYVSVGVESAPAYHGSCVDGVKCFPTDLSGNPLTGMTTPLIELASTNRCKYSEDFSNAVWVSGGGGIAVATNTVAAPDGTTTADTLTASGANGTLIQDLGVVASAAKSGGLYLKRKTGTGNVDLTLDGGATWTTQTINSTTWTRCDISKTLADEDFGIRLVTSGDAVYAWGAMVATEGELTSYVPNLAASTGTRNADQFYYTGADIANIKTLAAIGFKRESGFNTFGTVVAITDGTANERGYAGITSSNIAFQFAGYDGGGLQWDVTASNAYTPGQLSSIAWSQTTNDVKFAKDGIGQTADTGATMPTVTRLEYGSTSGGIFQLNGYPGSIYGWTRNLSQTELGAVTA